MSEAVSISRRSTTDHDTSFASLRAEAIKLVEQISGQVWTDYNVHDPGITILEQLIYTLTDLIYRTEFPAADYLADDQGAIDFDLQALHPPNKVLPCRPSTILDYRKVFLDGVDEIENVWLLPLTGADHGGDFNGLYEILVKMRPGIDQRSRIDALRRIRDIYNRNRNLCEDAAEVRVVDELAYELCAQIEVSSGRRPEDILAEIYFECSRKIAGSVEVTDYRKLEDQAASLTELFTGPLTGRGLFQDSDFVDNQREFLVSDLYFIINSIRGVDHVRQLFLLNDDRRFYEAIAASSPYQAFALAIPQTTSDIKVVLTTNGRELPVSMDEVRARFDEISFKHYSSRSTPQSLSLIGDVPRGVRRQLGSYASIHNQFPAAYGIGLFGLPESAPVEVKAKARQLKSYLTIFDQLLTNYLANLNSIRSLFSVDVTQRNTYAFNLLDHQQISELDSIYPEKPDEVFRRVRDDFDDFHGRRNRVLDYLLALYGEGFTQNSLRNFSFYYDGNDVEDVIVRNKIDYLQSILLLGKDRASAPDYAASSWQDRAQCGLQLRVAMLLGFEQRTARPLTMAIFKQGIRLTRHRTYEELKAGSHEFKFIDVDAVDRSSGSGFEPVPVHVFERDTALDDLRQYIGDAIPLKNNMLSDMLLRGGIALDRYRIGSLTSNQDYQLVFVTADDQYWYLGTYSDHKSAVLAANALRLLLIMLNKESEGLHIVEHILLRPLCSDAIAGLNKQQREFFSHRISVIFPAWTARCHDRHFRQLAEETVRLNAPAHVLPDIYWLDFRLMYEFEILYERWQELKANPESDIAAIDACARELAALLVDNQNGQDRSR